jgi:hypothetical protein
VEHSLFFSLEKEPGDLQLINNMNTTLYTIASPLEQFEVNKLVGLDAPVIGLNFSLTNLGFYVLLVLILFIGLQVLSLNSNAPQGTLLVPSR